MIRFNPNNCLNCLACMTSKCSKYIYSKRYGVPFFKEKPNCKDCTECIDICGKALSKTK